MYISTDHLNRTLIHYYKQMTLACCKILSCLQCIKFDEIVSQFSVYIPWPYYVYTVQLTGSAALARAMLHPAMSV